MILKRTIRVSFHFLKNSTSLIIWRQKNATIRTRPFKTALTSFETTYSMLIVESKLQWPRLRGTYTSKYPLLSHDRRPHCDPHPVRSAMQIAPHPLIKIATKIPSTRTRSPTPFSTRAKPRGRYTHATAASVRTEVGHGGDENVAKISLASHLSGRIPCPLAARATSCGRRYNRTSTSTNVLFLVPTGLSKNTNQGATAIFFPQVSERVTTNTAGD